MAAGSAQQVVTSIRIRQIPPSCAVSPSDDVFRMSGSPPADPAECRGIRNWGLACHKY